jgi:bud emergence protein 1
MEEYWFRVHTVFQPYNPNGSFDLPPPNNTSSIGATTTFTTSRSSCSKNFPREAGREVENPSPRLIPYMPGPVEHVDDEITLTRKDELDKYLRSLCKLKETTAKYILESIVVRNFLRSNPETQRWKLTHVQKRFKLFLVPETHQTGTRRNCRMTMPMVYMIRWVA